MANQRPSNAPGGYWLASGPSTLPTPEWQSWGDEMGRMPERGDYNAFPGAPPVWPVTPEINTPFADPDNWLGDVRKAQGMPNNFLARRG